jgi:hypothetical protein
MGNKELHRPKGGGLDEFFPKRGNSRYLSRVQMDHLSVTADLTALPG